MNEQPDNPLHGMKLEMILNELVTYYGWGELGIYVRIKCFNTNPSVKSSLTFLRRNEWARKKVENLYLDMLDEKKRAEGSPWPGRK